MSAVDDAATVREWLDVIRRAEMDRTTKLVAVMLASYADADGSRIFPGVSRLAVETGSGYSTVRRVLAFLRKAGLLKVVRRPTKARPSTEYRLTLGDGFGEHIKVPTPTEHRAAVKALDDKHRSTARSGEPSNQAVDSSRRELSTAKIHRSQLRAADANRPLTAAQSTAHPDEPLPITDLVTRTTNHLRGDLRTDVAVVGALPSGAPPQPPTPVLTVIDGRGKPSPRVTPNQPALWPALVTTAQEATMARTRSPALPKALQPDPPASPDAPATPTQGHGFCLPCYADGQVVVATDPVAGSTCQAHERTAAAS